MMPTPRLHRFLEILVVAVLVAGTAWLGKLTYHNTVTHGADAPRQGVQVAPVDIPAMSIGGQLVDLTIQGRERSLILLVLSTSCRYCEQNMPAWHRLVQEVRSLGPDAPELVALSVSTADETQAYLQDHGIDVPVLLIDPTVLTLLGLTGYPSTLTVERTTRSMATWSGVLEEGDHRALLSWARTAVAEISSASQARVSGN